MTIGEKIRELRKKNNITQEDLASYLHITSQSISKWENNVAIPDISLVVPLANFFGVTTDELFDRTDANEETDVQAYLEEHAVYAQKGQMRERIAVWRRAVAEYPRNFQCLRMLASTLYLSVASEGFSYEESLANLQESIEINERILADCTDNHLRFAAIQTLVLAYSLENYPTANEEKAVRYAMEAPNYILSREVLLQHAYFTPESAEKKAEIQHQTILSFLDQITMKMLCSHDNTSEGRIFACEAALKLWETVIYDGNYLFYHERIGNIYRKLATIYAGLRDVEKTIAALQKAKEHYRAYDTQPEGKLHYTSVFVCAAISDITCRAKNYSDSDTELFLHSLTDARYDFIRENDKFCELFVENF